MNVDRIVEVTGGRLLTDGKHTRGEVACAYACDMLSWVMSHARAGMALITVQSHMNVVAVASMMEMSAVILPEGIAMEQSVLDKANAEGVAVISTAMTAYEVSGLLYRDGVLK